jgi:hypothetical protein
MKTITHDDLELVGDLVGTFTWNQARSQIATRVWREVAAQVLNRVWDQVWIQVEDQIRAQLLSDENDNQ